MNAAKNGAGILAAAVILGFSAGASAAPWVLDFDTDSAGNANAITNGQIIDDEYASQIFGAAAGVGVTISVHDYGYRKAVAFPSNNDYTDTTPTHEDNDLRHVNDDYRNILIIQEDGNGCTSTVCASPDDDYSGGYLKFVFTQAVNLTGMDVFDIDDGEAGSKVYFFNEGEGWGDSGVETIDLPTSIGDGNVGFVGFGDKGQNITMMKIKFTGSGAIDNITGQTDTPPGDEVPEPGALAIIFTGLLGYGLTRRRRTSVVATA